MAADVERLVAGDDRWAVGEVVERHHARQLAVDHLGARCRREQLVHRAAFVGLDMSERDPAQLVDIAEDPPDRVGHQREQRPHAGVEQERFLAAHEKLVEDEPRGRGHVRDVGAQAEDVRRDLVDSVVVMVVLLVPSAGRPCRGVV